jgi:hypothetical protein
MPLVGLADVALSFSVVMRSEVAAVVGVEVEEAVEAEVVAWGSWD